MSVAHSLTAEELRVLACLVEKSYTTPDQYPLSTNALATACNQKTSREPVVDYSPQLVDRTLQLLRDAGWVRMIRASGSRAFKHRHIVDERLGLTVPQQAVLTVLALRGPQSPGELKTRTERYHPFGDLDEVERVLQTLAALDVPLTRNVGRASGQSQDRWIQLLGPQDGAGEDGAGPPAGQAAPTQPGPRPVADVRPPTQPGPRPVAEVPSPSQPEPGPMPVPGQAANTLVSPQFDGSVEALEARVERLESRLAALERELGL